MKYIITKLKNILKRAYVSKVMEDINPYPVTKISYFDNLDVITEVLSPYGLNVNLPENTMTLTFAVQGKENNRISIGYSQTDRFKNLLEGEVIVGNPKSESSIKFDKDGNIIINSLGKVTINSAENVAINSITTIDITCAGAINIDGGDINIVNGTVNITGDAEITADNVKLNAAKIDLGVGGNNIARFGDTVQVSLVTGTGTITSGGINTSI